ncbi:MAG TPA: thioredoxin family protein [Trichormus sp.]|jgi:thioredoxin 1
MKEAFICFVIALIIGSIINGTRQLDVWGSFTGADGMQASTIVPAINENQFQHVVLESDQPVLVEFYTDDCPHCLDMVPVMAHLATDLKGNVKVVRMDAGECASIAEKYGVTGLPNFTVFKDGEKIDNTTGSQTKDQLLSFIKNCTAQKPSGSAEQDKIPHQSDNQG